MAEGGGGATRDRIIVIRQYSESYREGFSPPSFRRHKLRISKTVYRCHREHISLQQQAHFVRYVAVFNWYILVKEGDGFSVQQCADEQTAKATVIALFLEQREVIEAGRLRGPAYEVIEGAEVSKWANGCRRPELVS